jgi:antitoxin YefM
MSITASEARKRLYPLIAEVNEDQEAIEIVSKNGTAFLVSEDEYRGWKETEYLLRSPAAAGRLLSSLQNVDAGRVRQHQLLTPGQPELAGEERNPDVE